MGWVPRVYQGTDDVYLSVEFVQLKTCEVFLSHWVKWGGVISELVPLNISDGSALMWSDEEIQSKHFYNCNGRNTALFRVFYLVNNVDC